MEERKEKIYAFVDSQNLNLGIRDCGWRLDFKRFRIYLRDKYQVEKVFLCIGYVPGNEALYTYLQSSGYIVVFKPTLEIKKPDGVLVKGNVDAELVLHTMIEYQNYDKAIIVSGDGDFHCLIEYLVENNKLHSLMIPNQKKYSVLLRKFRKYFIYLNSLEQKLSNKKERE